MTIKEKAYFLGMPVISNTLQKGEQIDAQIITPAIGLKGYEETEEYAYLLTNIEFTISGPNTITAVQSPPVLEFYDTKIPQGKPLPIYIKTIATIQNAKINELFSYKRKNKLFRRRLVWSQ